MQVNNNQILVYDPGNNIYYKSMNGLDIEIGKRFTETDTIFKNVGIYAKIFKFFENDTPTMTGRQLRINKQFGNRDKTTWKIGVQWRDDNIRDSKTEATIAISIPFGKGKTGNPQIDKSPAEIVESRMTEQPGRDLDVIVGKSVDENPGREILIENPAEGVEEIKVWYVTQAGENEQSGKKDSSISLETLLTKNNIRKGDIIVLEGKINLGGSYSYIELTPHQQLISGLNNGHAIVRNPVGEGTLQFKPEVEAATLSNSEYKIKLSRNNVISGIHILYEERSYLGLAVYSHPYMLSNYSNINNNIFEYKNAESNMEYTVQAYISAEAKININIVDNKFYNVSNAIFIQSSNPNAKINISGNEIYNFNNVSHPYYGAIGFALLLDENIPIIENNKISNYERGISFVNYYTEKDNSAEIKKLYKSQSNNIFKNIDDEVYIITNIKH